NLSRRGEPGSPEFTITLLPPDSPPCPFHFPLLLPEWASSCSQLRTAILRFQDLAHQQALRASGSEQLRRSSIPLWLVVAFKNDVGLKTTVASRAILKA